MPRRLGQHFLINQNPIKAAIKALAVKQGDTIIEIGPGKGAITIPLFYKIAREKARLILIERDPWLYGKLEKRLKLKTDLIKGDALKALPPLLAKERGKVKVIGSIPYYITGRLLRVLGDAPLPPERVVLILQREVAERISSRAPQFNILAASVQFWAEPVIIMSVPRNCFKPPPKVDSALILLKRKEGSCSVTKEQYNLTLRIAFRQPRKTLLNNIRQALNLSRNKAEDIINSLNLPTNIRPQELTLENIVSLAKVVWRIKVFPQPRGQQKSQV
jgi:16S rRNA (adenine1518-N6/adenine1519-N6)-dimethyltransferase